MKNNRAPRLLALTALFGGVILLAAPAARAAVLTFDVSCGVLNLGKVTVDLAQYTTGTDSQNRTTYSYEVRGGFDANPAAPCPDANYRWIQVYKGEPTLYSWEEAENWSYDRSRSTTDDNLIADGSPFYVNLRGPGYGYSTLGYYDRPTDYLNLPGSLQGGAEVIQFTFQTALVCFETGANDIHVIDGFTWSFMWFTEAGTANQGPTSLTHGINFADFQSAWNSDPDQATLGDSWDLVDGGCCCIPEPVSSGPLIGLVLAGGVLVRRRQGGGLAA